MIETPYAFNLYKLEVKTVEKLVNILSSIKNNAIVTIKCPESISNDIKQLLESCDNIKEHKVLSIIENKTKDSENSISIEDLQTVNHLEAFVTYVKDNLEVNDLILLDVTPLSLGIETLGNVMTVLIPRNTTIPATKSQVFSTAADNQPAVDIHILQGERPMVMDNKTLGRFQLGNIPPAPRGVPQIEVKFDIDANGIVNVSAKDLGTGKVQTITITGNSSLSDEEIDRMVKEAEANADADKAKKEEAELRNQCEQIMFAVDKSISDLGEEVTEEEKQNVETAKAELKTALEGSNLDEIKAKKEALEKAAQSIAVKAYEKIQKEQQNNNNNNDSSNDSGDGTVDAEYEDVK